MNIDVIINRHFNCTNGIHYLIKILKEKFPNIKLNVEILKTLKIEPISLSEFRRTGLSGIYQIEKKRIGIFTNKDKFENQLLPIQLTDQEIINTCLHELIHALTSKIDANGDILEGINIRRNGQNSIFVALNEGITQMITDDVLDMKFDAYPFEKNIAQQLSIILGRDKLIDFYSNNNYESLIEEIDKLAGENIGANLIHKIFLFQQVLHGNLLDDGMFIGDIIQQELWELGKKVGKTSDAKFSTLFIDEKKAEEYLKLLQIPYDNIEKIGFRKGGRRI